MITAENVIDMASVIDITSIGPGQSSSNGWDTFPVAGGVVSIDPAHREYEGLFFGLMEVNLQARGTVYVCKGFISTSRDWHLTPMVGAWEVRLTGEQWEAIEEAS